MSQVIVPPLSKPWYKSKTLWFNVFAAAVQIADAIVGSGLVPQPYGAIAQSIVNVLLRFVTSQPITVA